MIVQERDVGGAYVSFAAGDLPLVGVGSAIIGIDATSDRLTFLVKDKSSGHEVEFYMPEGTAQEMWRFLGFALGMER